MTVSIRYPITGTACDGDTLLRAAGIPVPNNWSALCAQADAVDAERTRQRLSQVTQQTGKGETSLFAPVVAAWLGLRVALLVMGFCVALPAMQWDVDDSAHWYDITASHHFEHGRLGFIVGGVCWGAAWLGGAERPTRVMSTLAVGVVVGFGFEFKQHEEPGTDIPVDAIDALWVVAGSALAAGLGELGLSALSVSVSPDHVAIGYVWKY